MFERGAEARIRDLEKRVGREPGSRFFVPLAEEYRKAGRLPDAIRSLEEGLALHPAYVAARVALGRAYLEAGRIADSISAFSRALVDDPANLVAAKALADLHMSRSEPAEALRRYRLYREISGDRRLDGLIGRLESETAPPADEPSAEPVAPPPPAFAAPSMLAATPMTVEGRIELTEPPTPRRRPTDPFDITSVPYRRPSEPVPLAGAEGPALPSRDLSLDALRRGDDDDIVTRKIRLPEATWPFEAGPASDAPPAPAPEPAPEVPAPEPTGRTLADLYFEQSHYAEAARAYAELLQASASDDPSREELAKLLSESRARSGAKEPALPAADPARERRLAKIAVLNAWIDVVKPPGTAS